MYSQRDKTNPKAPEGRHVYQNTPSLSCIFSSKIQRGAEFALDEIGIS